MTRCTALLVSLDQLRKTRVVNVELPALAEGEILVAIDKLGLTAMNVTYATAREKVNNWGFPAEGEWCKVPAWGYADVLASNVGELSVGERLYGFFPIASHAIMRPGQVCDDEFIDTAESRQKMPETYNRYRRTLAESALLREMEIERCLMFPLFLASYMVYDYLVDNDFFGARQIVISSASSKTGFGLSQLLHDDSRVQLRIVGLTSTSNTAFVVGLGSYDQAVAYGDETQIDRAVPTAYVDLSGNSGLRSTLHNLLEENMSVSLMVGYTDWEQQEQEGDLPGAAPETFVGPRHVLKREAEWGPGVIVNKAEIACVEVASKRQDTLVVEWIQTADELLDSWAQLLDNKISPDRGLMVSLG